MLGATILVMSAVFYFGAVGALDSGIDRKVIATSHRLTRAYEGRPLADLAREIDRELRDGAHGEREMFLVTSPAGQRLAGNMSAWPQASTAVGRLFERGRSARRAATADREILPAGPRPRPAG